MHLEYHTWPLHCTAYDTVPVVNAIQHDLEPLPFLQHMSLGLISMLPSHLLLSFTSQFAHWISHWVCTYHKIVSANHQLNYLLYVSKEQYSHML